MHDEPLPQCQVRWDEVKKHHEDSVAVRTAVDKTAQQVLTLEQARLATMEDIKEIKQSLASIDSKVDNKFFELKIWILTSAIAGLVVLLGESIYFGGELKQFQIDTKRIDRLENALRPVKVPVQSTILGD